MGIMIIPTKNYLRQLSVMILKSCKFISSFSQSYMTTLISHTRLNYQGLLYYEYLEPDIVYFIWVQLFQHLINMVLILYNYHYQNDIQSTEKKLFEVRSFDRFLSRDYVHPNKPLFERY